MRASRRLALAAAGCLAATGGVVTAIALPAGATAPVFGYGAAQFVNCAAPSTLESPVGPVGLGINSTDLGGEPSIGITWQSRAGMYMAVLSTYLLSFDNTATPPG